MPRQVIVMTCVYAAVGVFVFILQWLEGRRQKREEALRQQEAGAQSEGQGQDQSSADR